MNATFKVRLGEKTCGEIYDAMEGARHDVKHGLCNAKEPEHQPEVITSLSAKLEVGKLMELTELEAKRLLWELDYAGERVAEWNQPLANAMSRKREEIKKMIGGQQ